MNLTRTATALLLSRFGPEWVGLSTPAKDAIRADFLRLYQEAYDVPDDTMPDGIALENMHDASLEYRRQIGGGNLKSYGDCLLVKPHVK